MPTKLYERVEILDACLSVFASHGYEGTSTAMLARAAGVSKALLFHHFHSKKDLYLGLLDRCLDRGRGELGFDQLATCGDFFDAKEQVSIRKAAYYRDNPDLYRFVEEAFFATPVELAAEVEEKYGTLIADRDREWERLFEEVPLREGVDRKKAFELVMLALDHCDRRYLSQLSEDRELDEGRLRSFLDDRNEILFLIRYGIEGARGAGDAD